TDLSLPATVCILSQQVAITNAILLRVFCRHKACRNVRLAQILFLDLRRSIKTCQKMEASTTQPPAPPEQLQARPAAPEPQPPYHKPRMTTVRKSPKSLPRRKTS